MLCTLLVAALLATAGCLDDDDDASDGDPTNTGTDTSTGGPGNSGAGGNGTGEPIVLTGTGMTGVTAGQPGASAGFAGEGADFDVPDGAEVLLAEIRWNDPVQDVNLGLSSPSQEGTSPRSYDHVADGGSPGTPDSPHSITVGNPEEGTWQLTAFGNGASAAMEYEWAVTIFFDDMPAGYTAFNQTA